MTSSDDPLTAACALLAPGERLVWAGRPRPRAYAWSKLRRHGVFLILFAGVAIYDFVFRRSLGLDALRELPLSPWLAVLAIALLCTLAYNLILSWIARGIIYGITDRRLFSFGEWLWPWPFFRSFPYDQLGPGRTISPAVGCGDVVFIKRRIPWWARSEGDPAFRVRAFYGVDDARQVAEEIERQKQVAREQRSVDQRQQKPT